MKIDVRTRDKCTRIHINIQGQSYGSKEGLSYDDIVDGNTISLRCQIALYTNIYLTKKKPRSIIFQILYYGITVTLFSTPTILTAFLYLLISI